MSQGQVLGIDWFKGGWVAIALGGGKQPDVIVGADLGEIIERVPGATCVAVDMPIGLPTKVRACDGLARRFVGPRFNSVFPTVPQEVLYADTYEEANRIAIRMLDGRKISQQTYALAANIRTVETVAEQDDRLIEVHPEVSFRALIGEPVGWAKTTWNGQAVRRRHLHLAGITLPDELEEAGAVPVADVLDAAVAAWSARRYVAGECQSLPEGARAGERQVIWY